MRAAVLDFSALLAAVAIAAPDFDPFSEEADLDGPDGAMLGAWTTDHHDNQNSGRSPVYFNVSVYNGACQAKVAAPSFNTFFAATGATSTGGRKLYIGE